METLNRHPAVIVGMVILLNSIAFFGITLYLPSFPALAQVFHASDRSVQLTLISYFFGFALSQLIYGPVSDAVGRKPVLLFCLSLFLLMSYLIHLSADIYDFMIWRVLQGLAGGGLVLIPRVIMRDIFIGKALTRGITIVGISVGIAQFTGPVIGSYLLVIGSWHAEFDFLCMLASLMLVVTAFFMPETKKVLQKVKFNVAVTNYKMVFRHSHTIVFVSMLVFLLTGSMIYNAVAPFLFQNVLGLTAISYSHVNFTIFFGNLAGMLFLFFMTRHFRDESLLHFGLGLWALVVLALLVIGIFWPPSILGFLLPMMAYYFVEGILVPLCLQKALSPFRHISGTAAAIIGFTQMVSATVFGSILSNFHPHTQIPLAVMFTVLFILVVSIYFGLRHRLNGEQQSAETANHP